MHKMTHFRKIELDPTCREVQMLRGKGKLATMGRSRCHEEPTLDETITIQGYAFIQMQAKMSGYRILELPGYDGDCWDYVASELNLTTKELQFYLDLRNGFNPLIEEPTDSCIAMHFEDVPSEEVHFPHIGLYELKTVDGLETMCYRSRWFYGGGVVESWDLNGVPAYGRILSECVGSYVMFFRLPSQKDIEQLKTI